MNRDDDQREGVIGVVAVAAVFVVVAVVKYMVRDGRAWPSSITRTYANYVVALRNQIGLLGGVGRACITTDKRRQCTETHHRRWQASMIAIYKGLSDLLRGDRRAWEISWTLPRLVCHTATGDTTIIALQEN